MIIFEKLKERSKSSLWLIPSVMGFLGFLIFAASLQINIDQLIPENLRWYANTKPEMLSVTIGTLLAAIITVFGILLPMKISIIMRAAAQYTPKIIRAYQAALPPKLFVGFSLFTTVYLIFSLIFLNFSNSSELYFQIAVIDFILVLLCLFLIPIFFDYLIRSFEPTYIAATIFKDLKKLVEMNKGLHVDKNERDFPCAQDRSNLPPEKYLLQIRSVEEGYLQAVDIEKITAVCEAEDIIVALPYRVGEYVFMNSELVYVQAPAELTIEAVDKIRNSLMFGVKRVLISDLEILVEELVYIVLKALSPGINDLSTALQSLNSIGSCCNLVASYHFNNGSFLGRDGKYRVYTKEFDYQGFIHCAFDRIRVFVKSQPALGEHILNILYKLVKNCPFPNRSKILKNMASQIIEESKGYYIDYEQEKMNKIYEKIQKQTAHREHSK